MAKDLEEKDELDTEADEMSTEAEEREASAEAADDEADERPSDDEADDPSDEGDDALEAAQADDDASESEVATNLGAATKYVHAAFFAAGILLAYLSAKILEAAWNELAEWPPAVRAVPQLLRYAEDERGSLTLIAGAIIGVVAVIQTYRKEGIRTWAGEVAGELAKVTWPARDIVTNGTIVVVVASAIATVYIGLLDRLWGFLTNLVYGA